MRNNSNFHDSTSQIPLEKDKKINSISQTPVQNKSSLGFYYTNATSLVRKQNLLLLELDRINHPQLVCITETWFKPDTVVRLPNYSLFSRNRLTRTGGGVAIYVRNDVKASEICDPTFSSEDCEQVWCSIEVYKEKILVGCIYRPPDSNMVFNSAVNLSITKANFLFEKKNLTDL